MREKIGELWDKAKAASQNVAKTVADFAVDTVENTRDAVINTADKVTSTIEARVAEADKERRDRIDAGLRLLEGTAALDFVLALGESPLKLTENRIRQIKECFPLPYEQSILWADAEFDLRPSGIALTDKGVFIRTNVSVLDGKLGISFQGLDSLDAERQQAYLQHQAQYHSGKSALLFYSWNDFEERWFVGESELENKALLVEPQCSSRFVALCRERSADITTKGQVFEEVNLPADNCGSTGNKTAIAAASAVESAQMAVFVEQKSSVNTPAGHGEMAEEAITVLDKLHGLDSKVIGRDNAKNGADRQIGEVLIQTKYYNSARGSLEACFSPETGQYRYMNDGKPMQLEVPKDQYQRVLEGFKKKIENGKVPGVTDPNEASNIVREGRLTYQQAVNLTKPGTIESLAYDALTGTVTCTCALGISFVTTVYLVWRKTGKINEAIQAGASTGLQVFGVSFIQHMLVSQIARTGLANTLLAPSQYIVGQLGYQTSATIVNGIRALSGKGAIYGAAASRHLAKILRSNMLTSILSFAVFSVPETYNVASRKISGAQYVKNMSVLAGSIAAGAGGAVAAGVVAAKVAGAAGTAVAPGVGTVVGIAGGFVGGTVGAKAIKVVGDVLREDDADALSRLFNAYVSCMIGEYFLDEPEIDSLITRLNSVNQKEFKTLFESIKESTEQENVIRAFLNPRFEEVVAERAEFQLPPPESIVEAMAELLAEESVMPG